MDKVQASARPEAAAAAALPGQYLTFSVDGEMFAIGILHVKEIIEYGGLTAIPMTPDFIRGVINLRGAVVPVVDLAARFGGKPSVAGRRSCIVIVDLRRGSGGDMGVVVDAVSEVIEIPAADLEPPPAFGIRVRTDFIQGMGRVDGRFVVILDAAQVLSEEELACLPGAAAADGEGS